MKVISEGTKVFVDGHGETWFTVLGFDSAEGGWYDLEYVHQELRVGRCPMNRIIVPQSPIPVGGEA